MNISLDAKKVVFLSPPEQFSPKMEVAACYLSYQDKLLFLERPAHVHQGSKWGVPGGKIDPGETAKEAVVREVFEETSLTLSIKNLIYFKKVFIRYPDLDFIFHIFLSNSKEMPQIVINHEHLQFKWATLQEALRMPLVLGEDECLHLIRTT